MSMEIDDDDDNDTNYAVSPPSNLATDMDMSSTATADPSNLAAPAPQLTEQDATIQKRRAIQQILRDTSLDEPTRRQKIQQLMDGSTLTSNAPSASSTPSSLLLSSTMDAMKCVHYERNCNIVAPCCGKIFGCRVCHDEMSPEGHVLDRFKIREVVCKECHTRQPRSNKCIECGIQFGEYHCNICNLWMEKSKNPFHCADCGFCRIGGRENFRHCHICSMCINASSFDTHNCLRDKYKNNCPVCREDMYTSRDAPQDLPCGHAIHAHCFRKLAGFDYRCPICKKTVVSQDSMAAAWAERARDIERQPMPADLARVVNIMCNDCERKSENLNWHFLGVQCHHCNSFNTVVENVVQRGD